MARTLGQFVSVLAVAMYLVTALPGAAGWSLHRHGPELVHVHADHAHHGHVHDTSDTHHDDDAMTDDQSAELLAETVGIPSESIYEFDATAAVVLSSRDQFGESAAHRLVFLDASFDTNTPLSLGVHQAASRARIPAGMIDSSDSMQRILQRNHALLL